MAQQALAQAASAQDSRGEGSKRERAQSTLSDESLDQEHKRLMVALAQFATVDEVVAPLPIGTPEGLDPTLVRAARALELQRLKEFGVYTPVPRSEADRVVATRWVEVHWLCWRIDGHAAMTGSQRPLMSVLRSSMPQRTRRTLSTSRHHPTLESRKGWCGDWSVPCTGREVLPGTGSSTL